MHQQCREPDYTIITEGSPVLAKYKDDLWYRGRIEEHKEELKFNVKFDHGDDVLNLDLHSVYPVGKNLTNLTNLRIQLLQCG